MTAIVVQTQAVLLHRALQVLDELATDAEWFQLLRNAIDQGGQIFDALVVACERTTRGLREVALALVAVCSAPLKLRNLGAQVADVGRLIRVSPPKVENVFLRGVQLRRRRRCWMLGGRAQLWARPHGQRLRSLRLRIPRRRTPRRGRTRIERRRDIVALSQGTQAAPRRRQAQREEA